ncbi:DUF4942 domain-containing protein [Aquamicrobium sp.]|uniref:DUF4942 domain-containing protein n=1 Tax=Aquamicrobium sp. TaxID=1872579 RepID=UPI002584DA0C|nr:DUF4942 domain-containing protein [Aquamicrobium sp.]MCK9551159.1 DUF4942 domain-containing protein [Aquamicrobium sp.]
MSIIPLIKELQQNDEDFEFYPTTKEIIEAMYWDLKSHRPNPFFGSELTLDRCGSKHKYEYISLSMLDIGAGNGKVYSTLKNISESKSYMIDDREQTFDMMDVEYYAIEKSQILLNVLPQNAIVVGTDFDECTLIDKKVDVVFSNPPYKQYAQWAQKIIMEANAAFIYLVIPQRWGSHQGIANALKRRKAKVKIIGNFDFLNAEDRKARAKVSLVKVYLCSHDSKNNKLRRDDMSELKAKTDPFSIWFDDTFKISADRVSPNESSYYKEHKEKEALKKELNTALVAGTDLVSVLVNLYNNDLSRLISNYQKLGELDHEIFEELNVDIKSLLAAFKQKIEGLKNKYWKEIFSNLTAITSRLTSGTRESLLSKLISNSSMDFTESNIRAIVIWVINNASSYFEGQMISLYDKFTTEEGMKLYKSNQNFQKDTWRYARRENKLEKYALDYRVVLHNYRDWLEERNDTLVKEQIQNIKDIIIVAKNLGFEVEKDWRLDYGDLHIGEKYNIYLNAPNERKLKKGTKTHSGKIEDVQELDPNDGQGNIQYFIDGYWHHQNRVKTDDDIFTTVKGFKNGNTHYQFNQKFIKKLNLEVGRSRGWIKSPQEATEEMDITIEEATQYWDSNFKILPTHFSNLLPSFEAKAENEPEIEKVEEDDSVQNILIDIDVENTSLEMPTAAPQSLFDFEGVA